MDYRSITREEHEDARDVARAIAKTSHTNSPRSFERRSRCSLRISNASSGWDGFGYVDHVAQTTNSFSTPPPKTSANWPRSFLHRSIREKPEYKGARAPFNATHCGPATRCFSTESALCRHLNCEPFDRNTDKTGRSISVSELPISTKSTTNGKASDSARGLLLF